MATQGLQVYKLVVLKTLFGIEASRLVEAILFKKNSRRGRIEVVAEIDERGRPVEQLPVPDGMVPEITRILGVPFL